MSILSGFPVPPVGHNKVHILSSTYNQAKYIEDCLNGVAMQETLFPFVHQVLDDASTDGEQDIIKAWMGRECDMEHAEFFDNDLCTISLAVNRNNPNCTLVVYFLKKNMFGNLLKFNLITPWQEASPYQALCEGDDYWTDPKKLQKQVDLMDNHPSCTLCYHACQNMYDKMYPYEKFDFGTEVKENYSFDELCGFYRFQTATILYRNWLRSTPLFNNLIKCDFGFIDVLIYLTAAHYGEVLGLTEQMSVYRRLPAGYSTTLFRESAFMMNLNAWIRSLKCFERKERSSVMMFIFPLIKDACLNNKCSKKLLSIFIIKILATSPVGFLKWFTGYLNRSIAMKNNK